MNLEDKIKMIMARVFEMKIEDFPAEINQSTVDNWDSLQHLNLIIELEEAFGKSFEPEEIGEMTSMGKIMEMIKK